MISVQTIIAAPPSFVRDIFLDFAKLSEWHKSGHIKSIRSTTAGKSQGTQLLEGDTTRTEVAGMTVDQTILENSPTTLRMLGPWYGILTGTHVFDFQPHGDLSNQCLFTQSESFTGLLSPFMDSPSSMGGKKTLAAFEEVNRDLAVYAEQKWRDAAK